MSFSLRSTSFSMLFVSASVLPGEVVTETKTVPVSSSGMRPVFVVFTSTNRSTQTATRAMPIIHLRLNKYFTPTLYLRTILPKAASKAKWKREEKLSLLPSVASEWGVMMRAQSAGLSVRALTADMPTATAIVRPNCV